MNRPLPSTVRRFVLIGTLMAGASISGCSVFQPVGDVISQGYRNTVSYFNAYYNASRLFDAAVEEIQLAKRTQRSAPSAVSVPGTPTAGAIIPSSARQKLNSVIDKCSNILAFHGRSDLVDDALLLIARSYFLLGENVKSERKCTELLAQYPESDLRTEARILYGAVLSELSRPEEAEVALTAGLAEAREAGDEVLQARALESLSSLKRKDGDPAGALRYATQLRAIAPDNESVASAMLNEGQLLMDQEQPEAALEPLSGVPQATEDPYLVFDATMLRIEALRRLGRVEEALTLDEKMEEDLRFKDRLGAIALERARLMADAGRIDEAIAAYDYADTAFVRQASAAEAAFELGKLYEGQMNDYATAAKKFDRSGSHGSFAISAQARRRAAMFNRYFQLHTRLAFTDSLRQAAEAAPPDSTGARTNGTAIDSLETQVAITMQDLGEWFYSELERPDSAAWWLQRSLAFGRSHRTTPRGLYLMADLAHADSSGSLGRREDFLNRIVADYPESPYAAEARTLLGLPTPVSTDRSALLYRSAETAWDVGLYQKAADRYDSIATLYPSSPLVAKSLYASAWMYDNRLNRPDSAAVRYKAVAQQFGSTEYAEQARRRLVELTSAIVDTNRTEMVQPNDEGAARAPGRRLLKSEEFAPAQKPKTEEKVID